MFTTVENVKTQTGYDVTTEQLYMAQNIIETFCGRVEAEVTLPNDKALLAKATAFQAAYISVNYETVFEQVAVTYIGQTGGGGTSLDIGMASPFIAPLAIFSMRNLSWRKSRTIGIAPMYGKPKFRSWETA